LPNGALVLCDAGPLIALFETSDRAHAKCKTTLKHLNAKLLTTSPVLTEVFHFVGRPLQRKALWDFVLSDGLILVELKPLDLPRMQSLMAQYADLPMDFADASLVAAAERLRLRKVFTLDLHFRVYRPRHARSFEVFP